MMLLLPAGKKIVWAPEKRIGVEEKLEIEPYYRVQRPSSGSTMNCRPGSNACNSLEVMDLIFGRRSTGVAPAGTVSVLVLTSQSPLAGLDGASRHHLTRPGLTIRRASPKFPKPGHPSPLRGGIIRRARRPNSPPLSKVNWSRRIYSVVMGVKQIRPARVYKAAENELSNRILQNKPIPTPPWFEVVNSVPPSENAVRTVALRHRAPSKKATKPRNLYRPQQITYPEDSLRSTFYKDHPWELARPRNIVETDGRDAQRYDWSRGLRQRGMQLSGESVVQRQLWLMENQQMGREKAYDQARREFYRLRQEEEIERRVALEEAKYVGAYFGKSRLDVGLQLENAEYEKWKVWAAKESERREALLQESRASDFEDEDADVEAPETPGAATESLGAAESR